MRTLHIALSVLLGVLALGGGDAAAQGYPNRSVRIFVPFAAGGAVDTLARLIGNKLSEQFSQPVVVENRAGAGGNLAPDAVAKAAAGLERSMAQVALAWVLSRPGVATPIIGATRLRQLEEAIAASSIKLDPEVAESLEKPYRPRSEAGIE